MLCVPLGWVMDGWATALTGRLGCALVASGTVWARPRGSCWGNSPWRGQCWRVRHLVSLASLVALLARLHPTMVPVDAATLDAVMAAAVGAGAPGFDARSLACAAGCCRAWRRHARPGAVAAAGLQGPRDKRAAACRALGALGEEAQPHVDALIYTLEEAGHWRHWTLEAAAVEALASLHQAPRDEFDWQAGPLYAQCSEVLQQLGKLLYHSERTVSAAAAHVMFSLGEQVIEQHFYRLWELALEDGYSRGRFQVALETNGEYLKQEHVDCIIARLNVDDAESLLVCCTVLENAPGEFIATRTLWSDFWKPNNRIMSVRWSATCWVLLVIVKKRAAIWIASPSSLILMTNIPFPPRLAGVWGSWARQSTKSALRQSYWK